MLFWGMEIERPPESSVTHTGSIGPITVGLNAAFPAELPQPFRTTVI